MLRHYSHDYRADTSMRKRQEMVDGYVLRKANLLDKKQNSQLRTNISHCVLNEMGCGIPVL